MLRRNPSPQADPRDHPPLARSGMAKSRRAGGAQRRSAAQPLRWSSLPGRDHRRPVALTLTFCPGAEPWLRVEIDGQAAMIKGTTQLWELVLRCNGWS
jgi:hypothetical protein